MNYRHAFHAGNFADVFKHALLARILVYLTRKDAAFRYIDTHAGAGQTDLAGEAAARTGEWRDGIGRLLDADLEPQLAELLAPYLWIVGTLEGPGGRMIYPGSPRLAQAIMRPQDRASLCELHPEDARHLDRNMGPDARFRLLTEDGYRALKGLVPPKERRGVVLIDPPFESRDEFSAMEESLALAWRKWETGTFALWYPVKDLRAVGGFVRRLASRGIPRILRMELCVEAIRTDGPLSATGFIVVNPPFVLEAEARMILSGLLPILSRGAGASFLVQEVAGEAPGRG